MPEETDNIWVHFHNFLCPSQFRDGGFCDAT